MHHGLDPPVLHHQVVDHLLLRVHGWTTVSSLSRTVSRDFYDAAQPDSLHACLLRAHESSKPPPGSFRLIWSFYVGWPTDMTLAAGALLGEAGRQTVILKGLIAAWRCLPERSTLWSILVRIMPYCSQRLEALGHTSKADLGAAQHSDPAHSFLPSFLPSFIHHAFQSADQVLLIHPANGFWQREAMATSGESALPEHCAVQRA